MDVLDAQARISLVKADRSTVCSLRKVDEFLQVLSARRGRGSLGELKQEVEDFPNVLGEVSDIGVEIAVIDGEEPDLTIFERQKLREVRRAHAVQVFRDSPSAQA